MSDFVVLSFGLCAALFAAPPGHDDAVGIGNLRKGGKTCEIFYLNNATNQTISLQGHAIDIERWDNGMTVAVDGTRFFVPRGEEI